MSATTEIITPTEVVALAIPESSFDEALLETYILPAQRFVIKKFLGLDFYNEITDQVETASLTADNTALLDDYLKKALAFAVLDMAHPSIRVNVKSSGMMVNTSETSVAASGKDAALLRNSSSSMSEKWLNFSREFIKEEQDLDDTKYPLFNCSPKRNGSRNPGPIFFTR